MKEQGENDGRKLYKVQNRGVWDIAMAKGMY